MTGYSGPRDLRIHRETTIDGSEGKKNVLKAMENMLDTSPAQRPSAETIRTWFDIVPSPQSSEDNGLGSYNDADVVKLNVRAPTDSQGIPSSTFDSILSDYSI